MREHILVELKKNIGDYISGEKLCEIMGISRTAIWKHINGLRNDGYIILSSTRKGYKLIDEIEPFNGHEVSILRKPKRIGTKIIFLPTTTSTNNYLKEIARSGEMEGTVVLANEQTAGKGRLGRSWISSPGKGIWMSILLRPRIQPFRVQTVTLAVSVAVARMIDKMGIGKPGIKWPNDILLQEKKVCGILTEISAEADMTEYVVVGIGINVKHTLEDFPVDLKDKAVSLAMLCKSENIPSRNRICACILDELELIYDDFVLGNVEKIIKEWEKYNTTLGREILMVNQQGTVKGKAVGILEDGRLIVETLEGDTVSINSGEISIRGIMGYN